MGEENLQNSTKWGEDSLAGQSPPVSEEAKGKQQASGETKLQRTSMSGTKRKRSMEEDKASGSEKKSQGDAKVRLWKKIPVPPLPSKLPPANTLHRDVLWAWCQQLKLSTKGQKLDVYRRICEYAYPDQKNIPVTTEEAKILTQSQRRSKMDQGEMSLASSGKRISSDGTYLPEVAASPEGGAPAHVGSDALLEGVDTVVVTTSAPDAVFASWSRIAARAGKMETVESPQEAHGVRWCVVHGRSLPADAEGWVHLQFHAGQAWVPEKRGRVCALFLLPACNFPPPHLEDNMLCPKCVRRNKVLMKSLQ
ncbi:PREDICTED: developmental pluripotency-associated protein 4 [Odobenus rosmarus divergens]|uniref:Developmental pluripotency-associated protein 4 n=1 Tax=Odobenus rosmarus divergens TaxID=9708 RepID=A0A2U3VBQ5_ODORO|nr:PREDICTED: developmental pluripotency-associated protein 4 [Odobenus rosmarus divergens]